MRTTKDGKDETDTLTPTHTPMRVYRKRETNDVYTAATHTQSRANGNT